MFCPNIKPPDAVGLLFLKMEKKTNKKNKQKTGPSVRMRKWTLNWAVRLYVKLLFCLLYCNGTVHGNVTHACM